MAGGSDGKEVPKRKYLTAEEALAAILYSDDDSDSLGGLSENSSFVDEEEPACSDSDEWEFECHLSLGLYTAVAG